ncbi:cytochrome P450 [Archangium sp.]|uniref:cytochrome P450 n=1 Tax=Archangium sp. TaxID=1872627 RepID=UPI002D6EA4C0|nr:cytochrome P450 [Archangium sp.]HYO53614.1 cytochrome P450 [Archangium sp.]
MSTPPFKPIPRIREPWLVGSWSEFQKDRLGLLLRVGRECGEVGEFRIGPVPFFLINSVKLLSSLLVDHAADLGTEPFFKAMVPVLGRTAVPGLHGEHHRRIRRIMAPAFQHKRLVGYSENMVMCADQIQRGLQDGAEVDMVRVMQNLVREILVKSLYNVDMVEGDAFFESVHVVAEYISARVANPLMLPLAVPTSYNRRAKAAIKLLRGRAWELLEEGRRRGEDKGDVLSMLILAKDEDGSGLTEEELLDQILTLYMAGLETTANALSFAWLMLARHPDVQARLHAEVDAVLGGRAPGYADLARLPYSLQVLKETLRLYPSAFFFARAPLKDIVVEGYQFRQNQFLAICPYVHHRNPEYFPDPERFDPERFTPENEKKLPRNAYMPFGTGPRVCIGQFFALLEAHLTVAHMSQFLSVSFPPQEEVRLLPLATLTPSLFRLKISRRKTAMALAS